MTQATRIHKTALGATHRSRWERKRKETDHGAHGIRSALAAEAVTPELRAAAAGDGFVTYDELKGPDLDAARWRPARPPLPTGGEHLRRRGGRMDSG
jgi:hypothetical protein